MRGLGAWLRVRGVSVLGISLMATIAAVAALPARAAPIPMREGVAADSRLLIGGIAAVGLEAALFPGLAKIEVTCRRPAWGHRAAVLGAFCAAADLVIWGAYARLRTDLAEVACRNFFLCAGLTLITAVLLPRVLVWMPVTALAACTWMFGTIDLTGSPRAWAIMFKPADPVTWAAASVTFATGALLWIRYDGRAGNLWPTSSRRPRRRPTPRRR